MRSMPQALLWEMFAGGWWSLTGMTLMSCLIPMLVHAEMMKLQVDASDPAMGYSLPFVLSQMLSCIQFVR